MVPVNSQTERTDEHVPTGAIEYKNPSSELHTNNNDNQYYSQNHKTGNQAEAPLLDSETSASQHVKFSTSLEDHEHSDDDEVSETQTEHSHFDIENSTRYDQNVFNKPDNDNDEKRIDSIQHGSFQYHKKDGVRLEQNVQDDYGTRQQETPIIQGKPFVVYSSNDHDNKSPVYEVVQGSPFGYQGINIFTKLPGRDDTIDLKPPVIIPQFEPNGHSRPYGPPETQPDTYHQTEIITKPPPKFDNRPDKSSRPESDFVHFGEGHIKPGLGQVISVNSEPDWSINHNRSRNQTLGQPSHSRPNVKYETESSNPTLTYVTISRPEQGSEVRVHPEYPHLVTKPKLRVPGPITISSGSSKPAESHNRPNVQFSLPIEATGDEEDSKTQTERPPSSLVKKPRPNKEPHDEMLETAYQTNFATTDSKEDDKKDDQADGSQRKGTSTTSKHKVPSQNMMPPPQAPASKPKEQEKEEKQEEGLKPPPHPSDVVGLSPPPVDITTTNRPDDAGIITSNESGLRPPPIYIPLKESATVSGIRPAPSIDMVPPSPRPSHIRPFLADILSEVNIFQCYKIFLLIMKDYKF